MSSAMFARRAALASLGLVLLAADPAAAQSQPQHGPLRPELKAAVPILAEHPHSYLMSEEVARLRLLKMGYRVDALRATQTGMFEAQVFKEDRPKKVRIDRMTGSLAPVP